MSTSNSIDRRRFLTSTTITITTGFAGCEDAVEGQSPAPTSESTSDSPSSESAPPSSTTDSEAASSGAQTTDSVTPAAPTSTASTPTASTSVADAGQPSVDGGPDAGDLMSGGADAGALCASDNFNGDHAHPLAIPYSDIQSGVFGVPYSLEDGGTGHTHTLFLTAYDILYLQAGTTQHVTSSEDAGHTHVCNVSCADS
jgi:hypothetical protein